MNLEIERKFLLKSTPDKEPIEKIKINQWYLKKTNGWQRVRKCSSDVRGTYYVHTIKKSISKSVNLENEKFITKEKYKEFVELCKSDRYESRNITKERWIYPHTQDDLIWEVDVFNGGHHMIIAEIEIPKKSYKVKIPKLIKDKLLLEVTGLKQFSNKNLSDVYKADKLIINS